MFRSDSTHHTNVSQATTTWVVKGPIPIGPSDKDQQTFYIPLSPPILLLQQPTAQVTASTYTLGADGSGSDSVVVVLAKGIEASGDQIKMSAFCFDPNKIPNNDATSDSTDGDRTPPDVAWPSNAYVAVTIVADSQEG